MNIPIAEFIGTFILVFVILQTSNPIYIAAALFLAISLIASVSGGHVNPAVSIAMFVKGSIKAEQLVEYIIPQILGGVSAFYVYNYLVKKNIIPFK
jgi:aquaporin Z